MTELTFPTKCLECGEEITEGVQVCVVRAGSAWKDGVAVITDGAVLYVTESYHERCAPERDPDVIDVVDLGSE